MWHRGKSDKDREKQRQNEEEAQRPSVHTTMKASKRQNKTENVKDCGKRAAQILSSAVPVLVWEERH